MEQMKAEPVAFQLGDKVSVVVSADKPWSLDWQYAEPSFVVGMRLERGAIDITIADTADGKNQADGFTVDDLALVERPPLYANPQPAAVDGLVGNKVVQRAVMASTSLGAWMSAALDDPAVCDAMKADIQEWFSAGEPVQLMAQALAQIERKPEDGKA